MDKIPVFVAMDELGPDSPYPVEVTVACRVTEGHGLLENDEVVTVSTSPHGVMTPDGREEFSVRRDQLIS
ncbi:hypothetical protein [Streptomyces sp. IBSBF 3136]|uniref:hypothetical protein n=1 Tax=Streptomyces sp. IBSBF 3136 TaxID=2903524 RepID=UPI002FDBE566